MSGRLNAYGYRIGDYPAWAKWARGLLAERDMTRAISTGNVRPGRSRKPGPRGRSSNHRTGHRMTHRKIFARMRGKIYGGQ